MAKSSLELAQVQANQALVDFQQNLFSRCGTVNLQKYQVRLLQNLIQLHERYEVTKQRFLIGKIAVLDLNDADSRKTRIKSLCQALQDYWNFFYNIRSSPSSTLSKKPLETDYDKLIK